MAFASATQRSFQAEYAPQLSGPLNATTQHRSHAVTQRSLDRSWASLTSPLRTGGRTPTDYSRQVSADAAQESEAKRLRELAQSTASIRVQTQRAKAAAARRKANMPDLVAPLRSKAGGPQRYNYTSRNPYIPTPNPAIDPPLEHGALLRTFPWSARPQHHIQPINENDVKAGYFATHWDDRFATGKYQPYQVELINTARPTPGPQDEQQRDEHDVSRQSSVPPALSATALGFGKRHSQYRDYVFHQPPTSLRVDPLGPVAAAAHAQQRIVLEVSPHLLEHLPPQELAKAAGSTALALAVPFNLARFVPQDSRDGQGKGGHLNASGLGYGKGHRNHAKYLHPNIEGDPQLAYFRSNHVS